MIKKPVVDFLARITPSTKAMILGNIAARYDITQEAAYDEVIDYESEDLLEYITGPERQATSILMQKYGFR